HAPNGSYTWRLPAGIDTTSARVKSEAYGSEGQLLATHVTGQFTLRTTPSIGLANVSNVQAVTTSGQVDLTCTNPGGTFDHVNIYRTTTPGELGTRVDQVWGTNWTDPDTTPGTTYEYTLMAADSQEHEAETPN